MLHTSILTMQPPPLLLPVPLTSACSQSLILSPNTGTPRQASLVPTPPQRQPSAVLQSFGQVEYGSRTETLTSEHVPTAALAVLRALQSHLQALKQGHGDICDKTARSPSKRRLEGRIKPHSYLSPKADTTHHRCLPQDQVGDVVPVCCHKFTAGDQLPEDCRATPC